jgi:4-hydroxy-2-oxoglutarate aldolase
VTGVANCWPQICIKLFELCAAGQFKEAQALQLSLAEAEWAFGKSGINGIKWIVAKY